MQGRQCLPSRTSTRPQTSTDGGRKITGRGRRSRREHPRDPTIAPSERPVSPHRRGRQSSGRERTNHLDTGGISLDRLEHHPVRALLRDAKNPECALRSTFGRQRPRVFQKTTLREAVHYPKHRGSVHVFVAAIIGYSLHDVSGRALPNFRNDGQHQHFIWKQSVA